ncbi:MAG: hypothetical protein FWD40_10000 [Treponema sp.]|nr:hypothetical protein [Treponema sp.]
MTVRGLLDFFENYYGEKYSGVFLDVMTEYFADCSDEFMKASAAVIIKRFSRSFNKAPDLAVIENNINEIYNEMTKLQTRNALPEPPQEKCDFKTAKKYITEINELFRKLDGDVLAKKIEKVIDGL